jgi:predicted AlkP superfamily phosphohydrolase/phosphomutase
VADAIMRSYYPAMQTGARVLMLGLDAADPLLIERWTEDGTLPHLARLKQAGTYGRLESSARWLAGSPWPTFYTGQPPSHHGIYHDFQWRHETMEYARPSWDWLQSLPFWRQLATPLDVLSFDVPMLLGCQAARGFEVSGWASHDALAPPASHPPELLGEIRRRFGEWPVGQEEYGRSSVGELLVLHRQLVEATDRSTRLACWMLEKPWDLAVVVFGALHRGGHRLWDRSSIAGPVAEGDGEAFDGALRDLYRACDRAVGDLVAAAGDASIMVFSVHGMMANTARFDLLDGMLARLLHGAQAPPPGPGLLRRLGETMPLSWRRAATRAVPERLRNRLVTRWATGGVDWADTPAFTLRADLQGYVRVNLESREPQGIVPAADLGSFCDRIAEGLYSFRDADTGEPVVADIRRATSGLFPDGPHSDRLPDLVVAWPDSPGASHRAVVSPVHGRVERGTPGRIPNGRSGNHRPQGFLIARGPGFPAGGQLAPDAHILDLAPTALDILGASPAEPLAGTPLQRQPG